MSMTAAPKEKAKRSHLRQSKKSHAGTVMLTVLAHKMISLKITGQHRQCLKLMNLMQMTKVRTVHMMRKRKNLRSNDPQKRKVRIRMLHMDHFPQMKPELLQHIRKHSTLMMKWMMSEIYQLALILAHRWEQKQTTNHFTLQL